MKQRARMSKRVLFVVGLAVVLVLAAACAQAAPLTEEALKNATYQGVMDSAVQLADGTYEGEPFVPGGASRPTVTYMQPYALGDLNGDKVDDAAVLLVADQGGSGSFVYLAAVLDDKGQPENVATVELGDRVQVQTLAITDGQIVVTMLSFAPDDPMCCPSLEAEQTYTLQGDQLVQSGQ